MRQTSETRLRANALLLLTTLLLAACIPLAGYDQQAYQNATSLKAATIAMVERSTEDDSFAANEAAVEDLLVRLSAAYEYANGVEHNNEAAKNWDDLIGDDDSMVKGWISNWRVGGSISPALLPEIKMQIAEGFDTIICLEANKRQLTACESLKRSE